MINPASILSYRNFLCRSFRFQIPGQPLFADLRQDGRNRLQSGSRIGKDQDDPDSGLDFARQYPDLAQLFAKRCWEIKGGEPFRDTHNLP